MKIISKIVIFLFVGFFDPHHVNAHEAKRDFNQRAVEFLQGYSHHEIKQLGDLLAANPKEYQPIAGRKPKSTFEALKLMNSWFGNHNISTQAITSDFLLKDQSGFQCVIVHRENVRNLVIDHELGHCFQALLIEALQKYYPEKMDDINNRNIEGKRVIEGFADLAGASIDFALSGKFYFLNTRIKELEYLNDVTSKDANRSAVLPYVQNIQFLKKLKNYLSNNKTIDKLKNNHVELLKYVVKDLYIKENIYPNRVVLNKLQKTLIETERWLKDNLKKPEVVLSASGLQYKVISDSNGCNIDPTKPVSIRYKSLLPKSGKVLNDGILWRRNISVNTNTAIEGWKIAFAQMKIGDVWELYVHPKLAYGESGHFPHVEGNALLQFKIMLLDGTCL